MRHIKNDFMRIQLQNALLAQEVAEAAKLRQSERARAQAADAIEKLRQQTDEQGVKKVSGNTEDGKGGRKENPKDYRKWRYRPDGTLEDDGGDGKDPGSSSTNRIDIKA